ncbi:Retrovirus-related Pol polyprotein from transposon 297 [Formica fusca]
MIGIIQAEEAAPGVFIGSCLVDPQNYLCPANVINTTDNIIEMLMPQVTIEEIAQENTVEINATQAKKGEDDIPRIEKVTQALRIDHLNKEELKAIKEICENYSDIFHIEGEPLTCTNTIAHKIATQADSSPVNVRPYRLSEKHKEVNRQVREMLKNKIIRPSMSQWNAPLLVVPKKADASGKPKLRVVVDFRKLNDLTIGDSFPLPNITDILDQLGNAKCFTTLDLASGYHQIPMEEGDKCKTAFSTPHGHYEYNRMPFGLKNAPATFQRLMNSILIGIQGIKCLVYLDDIVIYGASLQDHNKRLIEVLRRLRENNLKLQPDKCEFLRKEVTYLGHIITENGISPDPSKLEAVRNFPTPRKVKDIQAFIGLAGYYRKFIENFSKIAKQLTKLTKKKNKFEWTQEQQQAFEMLKEKLTTAPLLKYPDFEKEFIVTTDASDYAIGAILSQGEIGQDQPIAYASRILARAEQKYNTTEKELLAIVWAVKHFRPYLYGTKFTIVTDHKSLVWLFNVTDPGSRLIRWRLKLEEYDYEIIHKAGTANRNADALSRHVADINSVEEDESTDTKITREYTEDEKRRILYEYHDALVEGHQGKERTINRIRLMHNWRGLTKDVEDYITKCEFCQKNKLSRKIKAPLIITDTADKPFEKCALDIVGPVTITNNGNKYILTFQDNLTKFSKAIPIPNQEAATIAKEFATKIIFEHGIPEKILTDQGTNFLSEIFKNTCKLLKIEKIQTTAYHPESNGALERSHRTLAEYLRHYINADQTDWDECIPYAMFTYNTTPHTATGFTPFELIYWHRATLPMALSQPPKPTYTYDDYAQELKEKLRASQQVAKEHLKNEKIKTKENYDKKTKEIKLKVGEKVLLYDETVRRGRSKKLDSLWTGPYTIIEKNSEVNYTIKRGRKTIRVHINRLKPFIEN